MTEQCKKGCLILAHHLRPYLVCIVSWCHTSFKYSKNLKFSYLTDDPRHHVILLLLLLLLHDGQLSEDAIRSGGGRVEVGPGGIRSRAGRQGCKWVGVTGLVDWGCGCGGTDWSSGRGVSTG